MCACVCVHVCTVYVSREAEGLRAVCVRGVLVARVACPDTICLGQRCGSRHSFTFLPMAQPHSPSPPHMNETEGSYWRARLTFFVPGWAFMMM